MSLADLLKKGSLRGFATATVATVATDRPFTAPCVASVATVAVASKQKLAANDPAPNPDRWCWPRSTAMNTVEIDTFTARLARFTGKGLTIAGGEGLADKLVLRDREQGDWHSCFECTHLSGAGGWRCGNWQRAGVAIRARDAQLPTDFVNLLQRCDGFTQAIHFQKQTGGRHGDAQAN